MGIAVKIDGKSQISVYRNLVNTSWGNFIGKSKKSVRDWRFSGTLPVIINTCMKVHARICITMCVVFSANDPTSKVKITEKGKTMNILKMIQF